MYIHAYFQSSKNIKAILETYRDFGLFTKSPVPYLTYPDICIYIYIYIYEIRFLILKCPTIVKYLPPSSEEADLPAKMAESGI